MNQQVRVFVIGQEGVGVTSVVERFVSNTFSENVRERDVYQRTIDVDGTIVDIIIKDPIKQNTDIFTINLDEADAFIVFYSIISLSSFELLEQYLNLLLLKSQSSKPVIIVGNKSDLEDLRQVDMADGRSFAKENNCIFMETSALTSTNINHLFDIAARQTLKENQNDDCIIA